MRVPSSKICYRKVSSKSRDLFRLRNIETAAINVVAVLLFKLGFHYKTILKFKEEHQTSPLTTLN